MRMSNAEIDLFTEALVSARNYLEYGAGGSTRRAARLSTLAGITTVESDPSFIENQLLNDADVQQAMKVGRLRFLIADIGPTGNWGYPRDTSKMHLWPNYALCPYLHGYSPDLILVDGRFRVACSLAAALQAPEATVLIHDYRDRCYYHIIERFFSIDTIVDTLVRCRRRRPFDEQSARTLLRSYLYAPGDDRQTGWAKERRFLSRIAHRLMRR
jgi:hypothetical protein